MQLDPIEGEYKIPKEKQKRPSSRKVECPNCGHQASSQDINIKDKIAKCDSCSQVFSFQGIINTLVQAPSAIKKPIVGKQKDVDIYKYAGELSISLRDMNDWWAVISFAIGFFTLMGSFLAYDANGTNVLIPVSIGLPLFLFSIYRIIKYRENQVHIDVDETYLTITPSQKYLQRQKKYLRSDITQAYTKLHPESTTYSYLYIVHDGPEGEEHIKVGSVFTSRTSALYVEQELESFLSLPDEPVAEETKFD